MDVLTPEQRRKAMQHIKSKDTRIEITLRKELWSNGIRYRKNYKKLPGKPDIAITKYRIAVFCDGEFFHGKDWERLRTRLSKSKNSEYWIPKIEKTMNRDRETDQKLHAMGWTVIHFWESEIKNNLSGCIQTIKETIFENQMDSYTY